MGRCSTRALVGNPTACGSVGQWTYKLWCSATLFAAVAHQAGDAEVRAAAVSTLRHFKGDVKYTPKVKVRPVMWAAIRNSSSRRTC